MSLPLCAVCCDDLPQPFANTEINNVLINMLCPDITDDLGA